MTPTQSLTSTELQHVHTASTQQGDWTITTQPVDTDNIVTASLAADATVPDGGYGLVIVAACSMLIFWASGTQYCWGVIQAALVVQGLSSPSTLAFAGSMSTCLVALLAIMNARLIRVFGARSVGLVGVGLMALGQILSGFATKSIGGLFITNGLIAGVGFR
jgi:hypothetical protein